METTTASDVIAAFESLFADRQELPYALEFEWLKQAIARYSIELDKLNFDAEFEEFDSVLDKYVIDTLAQFMKESYQERQVSLVNKTVSIVGKDLSIEGKGTQKTAERLHLEYVKGKSVDMVENQKPTAYA